MYLFLKRIKQKIVKKKKINYHKSYSQCGEDLIVKYIFDVIGISNPSYLDIGAHHPFSLSNTALFYKMGSRGVNVEPDPVLFLEIAHNRKRDINLNIGVAEKEGILDFYIIDNPVLNTFSKKEADEYCQKGEYKILKTLKVKVISPQQLIADYCNNEFPQFLSIDAEGIDDLNQSTLEIIFQ
jgi:FkbM family methyltransferase